MSLYDEMKAARIPMDHHESDLYVLRCVESKSILLGHVLEYQNSRQFIHAVTGEVWIEIPFAYKPWWEARHAS